MIVKYFVIAVATAAVTFTTSTTSIFEPIRRVLSRIHTKVEELIHCPYCSNFWLTVLVMLWVPAIEIFDVVVPDFFITVFFINGLAGVVHFVLLRAYKPVSESEARRKLKSRKK